MSGRSALVCVMTAVLARGGALRAQAPVAGSSAAPGEVAGVAQPLTVTAPPTARDPNEVKVAYYVDEGFFETGIRNHEAAITAFRKALEIAPRDPKALFGLGTALINASRDKEAEDVLRQACGIYPGDYMLHNNLAWLYATARDPAVRNGQLAVAFGRQALILNPADFHVWSTMAEAYYVSGEYARATRFAEEALRMALQSGQPQPLLDEYRLQFRRCSDASRALSILD